MAYCCTCAEDSLFQSTPPVRGATDIIAALASGIGISIHAPREGGDGDNGCTADRPSISIHAPREGGDVLFTALNYLLRNFNPRPPRGGRLPLSAALKRLGQFQSTPPARGATHGGHNDDDQPLISIHAPREGGRPPAHWPLRCRRYFNPRPPRGGRQPDYTLVLPADEISIHAPREGATVPWWQYAEKQQFQSTPPTRGATWVHPEGRFAVVISIHAPHEGGDFRQFTGG